MSTHLLKIQTEANATDNTRQPVWLVKTKQGEVLCFDEVMERYYQKVFGLCQRMLRNKDEAAEATQIDEHHYSPLPQYPCKYPTLIPHWVDEALPLA